jgi:MoaA/NifB/PqqE/SkfB family radical SAM enzyme
VDPALRHQYDAVRSLSNKAFRSACYAPFVSLFFATDGRVLACCKNGTYVLGHVRDQRLRDIWTGPQTAKLRDALRAYRFDLDCGFCEWEIGTGQHARATPLMFDEFPVASVEPDWPVQIEFEGSNTCNFECVMCNGDTSSSIRAKRDGLPPLPRAYGEDFFRDLRPFLPHLKRARFFGGEPFLTPESQRIWDMMIEDRLATECHVTTNGSQYNDRIERMLEALPFFLVVSIDGATKATVERIRVNCRFEQLIENIKRFQAYATRRRTSFHLAFCLMRQNWHEFGDLLLFAESLGVEVWVNTVVDPSFCSLYTLPPSEIERVLESLDEQSRTLAPYLIVNRATWEHTLEKLRSAVGDTQRATMADVLSRYYVSDSPAEQAALMNRRGQHVEALALAQSVSDDDQRYYYALDERGYSQIVLGDLAGAQRDLTRALEVSRKRPEAHLNLARLYAKQDRTAAALESAREATRLASDEDRVQFESAELLAHLFVRQGRLLQAVRAIEPIARLQGDAYPIRGLVYPRDGLRAELLREAERNPDGLRASLTKSALSLLLGARKRVATWRGIGRPQLPSHPVGRVVATSVNVSIITPAFNAADTIADTLESLLRQTAPDWEAIVVDDGSTDSTAEIVAGYAGRDGRIRMLRQPNSGESGARNAGLALARGAWVLFLDADDWIAPTCLETLRRALAADRTLDAVHCLSARVTRDGTLVTDQYLPPEGDMFSTLAERVAFPIHACLVRRALVDTVGRFDTSLKMCPDWDLWQRVARTGARFGSVREVLAFYRMRPSSASMDGGQMVRDALDVLRRGHGPDPRVRSPHPAHANGLPKGHLGGQQFYVVSWGAGVLIGAGRDACSLLDLVRDESCADLDAQAVAECLFESAILPRCQPPHAWEEFWPDIEPAVTRFLDALEGQSRVTGLAERSRTYLEKLIARHSIRDLPDASLSGRAGAEGVRTEQIRRLDDDDRSPDWWLRVAEGNAASLQPSGTNGGSMRVAITTTTERPFDIQLNRARVRIESGRSYSLQLRARADDARTIYVGVARGHDPWDGLGLYQAVELTSEWKDVDLHFRASADEEDARIHFDLASSTASVEIAGVVLG